MEYLRKHAVLVVICAFLIAISILFYLSLPTSAIKYSPTKRNSPTSVAKEPVPDPAELEKLAALGYTNWSLAETDAKKTGVVQYEPSKAFDGLNLYNSRNLSRAYLVDMSGRVVHSWIARQEGDESWHTIKMMEDGDLLAIVKDQKLKRIASDSTIEWEYDAGVHHDVAVSFEGLIYVLTRRAEMWTTKGIRIPIVKEFITVLTGDGKFVKELDLFEALSPYLSDKQIFKIQAWAKNHDAFGRLENKEQEPGWWENTKPDVFHLNSLEFIDRDIPGVAVKGDLLLSVRELDLICIFRERTGELVWSWGPGQIQCQHHPTLLETGNILLFDNGCLRGYSRVIELDPRTKRVVWEYNRPKEFFSHRRGGVQRLPNGNTLITESDRGRVFEVTPEGRIVWEFLNPDVHPGQKKRAIIYRMNRFPTSVVNEQLQR